VGDSLSGVLDRATGENVGSYAITQGTLAASSDYTLTYVGADFAVTARPLTVTAVTDSKGYDGTTSSTATPSITSGVLQGTDTADFVEAFDTASVGTAKTLTPSGIVTDGNGGANYS